MKHNNNSVDTINCLQKIQNLNAKNVIALFFQNYCSKETLGGCHNSRKRTLDVITIWELQPFGALCKVARKERSEKFVPSE